MTAKKVLLGIKGNKIKIKCIELTFVKFNN
jgi:hypothetical protein